MRMKDVYFHSVRFEWDETKNQKNIVAHTISFQKASLAFLGPMLVEPDPESDYGEERFIGVGLVENRFVLIIFTEREPDVIRIISARKALKHERQRFEKSPK